MGTQCVIVLILCFSSVIYFLIEFCADSFENCHELILVGFCYLIYYILFLACFE